MKQLTNNKKGFTLIELLAVIVVLAIVMVMAATTIIPYLEKAHTSAFDTEVETVKASASDIVSLIITGGNSEKYKYDGPYYVSSDGGYCFTIADLVESGTVKNLDGYTGVVVVTKNNHKYTHKVVMSNSDYFVDEIGAVTKATKVTDSMLLSCTSCSAGCNGVTYTKVN